MFKIRHWIAAASVCFFGVLIFFIWISYRHTSFFCDLLMLFLFGSITIISLWIFLDLNASNEKEERARAAILARMAPDQRRAFLIRALRGDLAQAWNNRAAATRGGDFAAVAEHEAQIAKIEQKRHRGRAPFSRCGKRRFQIKFPREATSGCGENIAEGCPTGETQALRTALIGQQCLGATPSRAQAHRRSA